MNETAPPAAPTGLTSAEVAERVARGQVNRVRRSDWAEYADIVRRNVLTLFNAMVVPAAVALYLLSERMSFGDENFRAAFSVSGMAVVNSVLGLIQEVRAKWHLDKLTLLAEARARVVRDGGPREVPAGDVVLGDLILLAAGDPVVADGAVVEARFLEVDEALLTGESDPVPRRPGDRLLSGSFCVAGEGGYRADKVGVESFAQRTTAEARSYRHTPSPMQESIDRLIQILTGITVLLCLGYWALYHLRGGIRQDELWRMIAATVTSMVPQGLVLMTTLAFILGAVRMSARGALVQRLNAVEAMASVDVLCMDKTGTLTTNRLHLAEFRALTREPPEEGVRERLRAFASLSLDRSSKSLAAVREALGQVNGELLDQLPFKSQNRYSAVRVRVGGKEYALALGACEALRTYLGPGEDEWEKLWEQLLRTGLRLMLFAEVSPGGKPARAAFGGSLEGFTLRPLALVGLSDEVRAEAGAVLRHLAGQGIGFKILSGDNPETVRATVAPLGRSADSSALKALAETPVVSGAELESAPDRAELIRTRCVFGRVSPWQKVEVVTTLKGQGRHVAMIGDGVNDVLPIKNANLGIAMGEGSRATKTVSGLVLQTNDFGLLPQTLDEGRTIVRNLRRAGKLFLTKNVYFLVLVLFGFGILRLQFPFEPQQVTLLNFITIGMPALLITFSRERSPTATRSGFVREVGRFVLHAGGMIGAAGLLTMWLSARVWEDDRQTQQTLLLSTVIPMGLVTLLRALVDGEVGMLPGDRHLRWLAAAGIPFYLAVLYTPPAAYFFNLVPLTPWQWGRVLAVVALGCLGTWASEAWAGTGRVSAGAGGGA